MLYVLYGTDTEKTREKAHALSNSLLAKRTGAALFRIDRDEYQKIDLDQYIKGQGLFSPRFVVILDHLFEEAETEEKVLEKVKNIAASENVFILLEGALHASTVKKLSRYAEKIQECTSTAKKQNERFNVFSLTDAFGMRDRKTLWIRYRQAIKEGSIPEELHGILFWQLKTIALVSGGDTKGLKPFVISKARRFSTRYSPHELQELIRRFVNLYHEAHQGEEDLEGGLERLILSL